MKRILILCIGICLSAVSFCQAQSNESPASMFTRGIHCFNEQNYPEALEWFRKAADSGHASAQNWAGYMYQNGYGVTRDYTEALKWFQKSADQGYAGGQGNLGYMYYQGYGVTKDDIEALRWYIKAADQGNATAQYNLGFMYENGFGVTKNNAEAVKWFTKAASQGHENAQTSLANINAGNSGNSGGSSSSASNRTAYAITLYNQTETDITEIRFKEVFRTELKADVITIYRDDNKSVLIPKSSKETVQIHPDPKQGTDKIYDLFVNDKNNDTYKKENILIEHGIEISITTSDRIQR